MDEQMERFRQELMGIGIISYREHDRLWDIAQHCARTAGIPTAGAGAIIGLGAGSVSIPGIGAVPGAVVGALAGLAGGTMTCMMANAAVRDGLRELARGR